MPLKKNNDLTCFGQIIENLSSEIIIFNAETLKVLNANKAARKNLGYSLDELLNMIPTDINPDSDLDEIKQLVAPLKRGEVDKVVLETVHRRKQGTSYDVEVNLQIADHLGSSAIIANIFDISERIKSETFIKKKGDFLKLILDTSPCIIGVKDRDYNIVEANQKLLELYPEEMRDSVIGTSTVEKYTKEDREAFLENDRIAFETGYSEVMETLDMPMGKRLTLYTQKVRFEDAKGTPYILLIAMDVTDREELIQKLANSNEELERFAYVCSHDLQEPLRMIRSFSDRLKMHLKDSLKDDPKGQKYLHFVTDGAARSQQLIADILSYSSIDSHSSHFESLDVNQIVDVIKQNLALQLDEKQGKITHDILPSVIGHETQIYQLLQNLISNGFKYQSGGKLPHVHIGYEDLGEFHKFEVRDNGIGIDQKSLKKIFGVFQRLHRRNEYSGTGIGLAICKKVVDYHGGKIWVESEPGDGSRFFFTIKKSPSLPRAKLETEAA